MYLPSQEGILTQVRQLDPVQEAYHASDQVPKPRLDWVQGRYIDSKQSSRVRQRGIPCIWKLSRIHNGFGNIAP